MTAFIHWVRPSAPREAGRRAPRLWGLYAVLCATLAGALVAGFLFESSPTVQRFAPNLATEALSMVVTLAFVQRLLERQERARRMRAAVGALRKGRVALGEVVEAWSTLIKGALDPRRTEYPRRAEQLFASYYTEELACIDPGAFTSGERARRALAAAVQRIESAPPRIHEIITAYGTNLEADYLEALDELMDDTFAALVGQLTSGAAPIPEDWRRSVNRSRGHMEAHFIRLVHAVETHNRLAAEAARFRSRHLAPRAQSLSLRLDADRDLAIPTEFPTGWWSQEPRVGSLRAEHPDPTPALPVSAV